MTKINAYWHNSIQEISEESWKYLLEGINLPFYKWNWLKALETSDSVTNQTGWQPLFLSIWRGDKIIGAAPLYLKGHSYGEFIFDNCFYQLSKDLNLNYYPKLIGMSPFSPVEGYRFLISSDENEKEITSIMIQIIDQFAIENRILSCNFLYVDPNWMKHAESAGFSKWLNHHSVWEANSQRNFNEYLDSFNSNQKRNIKRERKSIKKAGLEIQATTGKDITKPKMMKMYQFYEDHCAKWGPWGSKYLTKSFFEELSSDRHKEEIVLFSAYKATAKEPLAMSLCVTNGQMLWGRYWGSKEKIDSLHFELCYYSPIAWALENGIRSFDPGAGGSHKLRRGFKSKPNQSLFRWYDKRMNGLIRNWLPQANELITEEIQAINCELPFRTEFTSI